MKTTSFLLAFLPFSYFAQKANDDVTKTSYHHIIYPKNDALSANTYCLTVNENLSCFGTIPGRIYSSPLAGAEPRSAFYLHLIPSQPKFFSQTSLNEETLLKGKQDFINIKMETSDIYLTKQTTKSNIVASGNLYYLSIEVFVNISVKVTKEGDVSGALLDTNATGYGHRELRFPMDAAFGTSAPDIKVNGYPSEAELLAAWKKYGAGVSKNWRDKYITDFISPLLFNFKANNITHEDWTNCKIYSDKNKKGGFDKIVEAATIFNTTIAAIDADYKNNDLKKFWKPEHQENFMKAGKIWAAFLQESNFDVLMDDALISDDYRQNILLNYIQAQIFTGHFEKAEALIDKYSKQKLRAGQAFELLQIKILNKQLKEEFQAHSAQFGWVKSDVEF